MGLIEPILSVFIIQNVPGATLATVGVSVGIYWVLRSILVLPISRQLDKVRGEQDDVRMLIAGLFIAALAAFSFGFVHTVWQLYLVQVVHAIAFACYSASWPAIFSRHLDKDKVSFDWSLDSVAVGISAGVSGFLGAILAQELGFTVVFVLAAVLSLAAAFILILSPEIVLPKPTTKGGAVQDHVHPT